MRGACVLCVACLLALAAPLQAQGPVIDHSAVACMVAEKFPQLEARIVEPEAISRARVQFRGEGGPWYVVEMKRSGGVFTGVLPRPKKSLKTISYYIEAIDREFRANRTQEFAASVVPQATLCADGKLMAGVASTASVIVGSPAGAAAVPAGFSSAGVASATGSSATAAGPPPVREEASARRPRLESSLEARPSPASRWRRARVGIRPPRRPLPSPPVPRRRPPRSRPVQPRRRFLPEARRTRGRSWGSGP